MSKRRIAAAILCLAIMIWSGYNFGREYLDQRRSDGYMDNMERMAVTPRAEDHGDSDSAGNREEAGEENAGEEENLREEPPIQVDFDLLRQECPDIVAWLYIQDTPISYPVVKSKDNSDYLHHLPDGRYAAAGTLFVDCNHAEDFTDGNTVIYGHNMKSGSMFGTLKKYEEQKYYEEHPVAWLLTPEEDYRVDIMSAFVEPAGSRLYNKTVEQEDLEWIIQRSMVESQIHTDVIPENDARLLTLSTCTYEYKDARFVLIGVLS